MMHKKINVLHIASIDNDYSKGTSVIVPKIIYYQFKKNQNVFFLNCNKNKINNIEAIRQYNLNEDLFENIINDILPDLVVFHEVYKYQFINIYKELIKRKIKYIIVPHGCLTKNAQSHKKIKKIIGNLLIFNDFVKNAEEIHYLSASEKNNTILKNKKYFIIPNGIFYEKSKNLYKYENCNGLNLIYVGRYDMKIKGLDLLFKAIFFDKAFFLDNNVKLKMYGTGNKTILEKVVRKRGLEKIIEINDGIFNEEKIKVITENDVFIQVSRTEGLPTGIIEAMSIGMPVIASEGTGLADVIEKFHCGEGCKTNYLSILNAIKKVFNEKNDLNKFSKNSYNYASKNYEWGEIANNTTREYKRIIMR